jgi:hypothetical protein
LQSADAFRRFFAEGEIGEIGAILWMRSHISAHRATTKYFSNSFIFRTEIEKEGLPGDITPALGSGVPEFKSRRPDQSFFLRLTGISKK